MEKLHAKEKNKAKKKKIKDLELTEDEWETIKEVYAALKIVMSASTKLCSNDVTLATADRVRIRLGETKFRLFLSLWLQFFFRFSSG